MGFGNSCEIAESGVCCIAKILLHLVGFESSGAPSCRLWPTGTQPLSMEQWLNIPRSAQLSVDTGLIGETCSASHSKDTLVRFVCSCQAARLAKLCTVPRDVTSPFSLLVTALNSRPQTPSSIAFVALTADGLEFVCAEDREASHGRSTDATNANASSLQPMGEAAVDKANECEQGASNSRRTLEDLASIRVSQMKVTDQQIGRRSSLMGGV